MLSDAATNLLLRRGLKCAVPSTRLTLTTTKFVAVTCPLPLHLCFNSCVSTVAVPQLAWQAMSWAVQTKTQKRKAERVRQILREVALGRSDTGGGSSGSGWKERQHEDRRQCVDDDSKYQGRQPWQHVRHSRGDRGDARHGRDDWHRDDERACSSWQDRGRDRQGRDYDDRRDTRDAGHGRRRDDDRDYRPAAVHGRDRPDDRRDKTDQPAARPGRDRPDGRRDNSAQPAARPGRDRSDDRRDKSAWRDDARHRNYSDAGQEHRQNEARAYRAAAAGQCRPANEAKAEPARSRSKAREEPESDNWYDNETAPEQEPMEELLDVKFEDEAEAEPLLQQELDEILPLPDVRIISFGISKGGDRRHLFGGVLDVRMHQPVTNGPWPDRKTFTCCGFNGRILLEIALHPQFRYYLLSFKQQLKYLMDRRKTEHEIPEVGVYCKSGRHRSVGVALLLAHCVERAGVYNCEALHLDLFPCGCPDQCSNLVSPGVPLVRGLDLDSLADEWRQDGEAALAVALRLWAHC